MLYQRGGEGFGVALRSGTQAEHGVLPIDQQIREEYNQDPIQHLTKIHCGALGQARKRLFNQHRSMWHLFVPSLQLQVAHKLNE